MDTKPVLITYATRFGSTQEVAEKIAASLGEAGFVVDVKPIQEVQGLDGYAAVILGAALYNAHWHPDAHQFLTQHKTDLMQRPVAIFSLGPISAGSAAMKNSRRQLDEDLEKYPWLKPVAMEMFAGKYDPTKPGMGFFYRLLPTRDYRNWTTIAAWASALPALLTHAEILRHA